MSIETGTYISDLVAVNPLPGDQRNEGDDHLRLIKAVLKATFPNLTGAVTVTQAELNRLTGVLADIPALLAAKASMPAGTVTTFFQAAAPIGWTQLITHDNKALRVVSGVGGGVGGTVDFTTAFTSQAISGTVGYHALTAAELAPHVHTYLRSFTGAGNGLGGGAPYITVGALTDTNPGNGVNGDGHNHSFTGTAINLAVKYLDIILASRD